MKIKKRKLFGGALVVTTVLALAGVKVPKPVVDFVNHGYTAAQGHTP